jgi:Fe-S cluster assembly protein SufD
LVAELVTGAPIVKPNFKMIEEQYIALFEQYRGEVDKYSAEGMNRLRDAALEAFKRTGFPTTKQEEYRHSNIVHTFDADLGLNLRNIPVNVSPYDAFKCNVPNLDTHLCFLVNDRYYGKVEQGELHKHEQFSKIKPDYYGKLKQEEPLPEGAFVGSLRLFSEKYPEQFEAHYGKIADYTGNGTVAYNTLFAQDGFVVYVPKNVTLEKPLQLINILRGGVDLNVNRRNLIIAEENARVKLLVCDHAVDDVHFVVTQVTEIAAEASAQVDLYELEENSTKVTRLNNLFCEQKERSVVHVTGITLHNGFTRNNYRFKLLGEHADVHAGGLAICDKKQHVDNFVFVDHAVPRGTSNQLFKTVLQEEATGVFRGRILVEKDAQQTLAYQVNRNLVMSDKARMFAQPQLEIYADDVKCSHGLTTGHLDEEARFYMQARGISAEEAQLMLMVAFTRDVVDMVRIPALQERLVHLIDKRFRGEFTRCGNCEICM